MNGKNKLWITSPGVFNDSNMEDWLSRTELLIGADNLKKLKASHVLVAGIGGVGGYAAEQLCRAGIGELTLIDRTGFVLQD